MWVRYSEGPSFASSALRSWSCSGTNLHAVVTDPATSSLRRWSSSTYVRSTHWVLELAARNLHRGRKNLPHAILPHALSFGGR
ncbi:unnamed protein product [Pieris brassicae]|uniref:Uncharacterized protein n=1 Tax=Pieris brassicae TaxID=7116 RepID=A0A9P0XFN0_PIEBR|nr:unnamed protein product [Pieris brassicae]